MLSISSFIDHLEWADYESVIQTRVPKGNHTNTASHSSLQKSDATSDDTMETQEAKLTTTQESEEEILCDHMHQCSAEANNQPYIPMHVEAPGYIQASSVIINTDNNVIDIGAIMDSQSDIFSIGET